jgi:hypothetical protein
VDTGPDEPRDDDVARVPDGARVATGAGASTGDLVAAATEELYGADPEAFTGRRGELAAAARGAGDRAAAKAIGALRRPTRAAWVVNQLARAEPGAPEKLAELAAALRAAQEAKHGPRLRELSAARGSLVDALTAQALAAAGVADPPPALRLEVAETLTAAIADPEVAADFAAGTLTRAVQWSGFGMPLADTGPGEDADEVPDAARRPAAAAGKHDTAARTSSAAPAATAKAAKSEKGGQSAADAARRQADLDARLAREAAERAARRREQYEEAEQLVASTATVAAEAVAAEDALESEVRDLEQRLTRARADLAGARVRARHAEAAERRARQALDRLPSE